MDIVADLNFIFRVGTGIGRRAIFGIYGWSLNTEAKTVNMERPCAGFLIVHQFEEIYLDYCTRFEKVFRDYWDLSDELIYSVPQRTLPPTQVRKKYRGIDRMPLVSWPAREFPDETWMGREEPEASQAYYDLDTSNRAQDDFILSLVDARHIYSLLRNRERWEIIWAGNSELDLDRNGVGATIGFEPTWFSGDRFSAVCDCMCFPKWHGTDKKGVLFANHYERLNGHALFNSRDDAKEFLKYYLSFDWTETGDYVIAEICLPQELPNPPLQSDRKSVG